MKGKNLSIALLSMLVIGLIGITGIAQAVSSVYYAKTTVYFNVPSDASFSISMPSNYASWTTITGTTEGAATTTDYITFNYTSGTEATLSEPMQFGTLSNQQAGSTKPIFYIDNTGNVNEQFTIYLGSASPTGITVYVNATCETCSSPLSGLNVMGVTEGSANTLTTSLANTDFLNVTLYSNVTGATGGITSRTIYIKSTAV